MNQKKEQIKKICLCSAKKYKTPFEWFKKEPAIYNMAIRNKIFDEATVHMFMPFSK